MRKFLMLMLGLLTVCSQIWAQRIVTGRVTDDKKNGVPNASITVKGTTLGTTTGTDGSFSVNVPVNARTLVISSVGFGNQEITIGDRTNIEVSLSNTNQSMDEVVVVAYGTAKRGTYTGAASQVNASEIGRQQIANLSKSLEGLAPGIKVNTGSGQPGSGADIRIRGIGSINASSSPLYVVDGVPYGGDVNAINPNDIESISILKDAASAALYGARGSNGVVMITTKRGKGKPRFELQARYGTNSRAIPEYDRITDAGPFLEVYWEALKNEAMNRATNPLSDAAARQYASNNLFSNTVGIGSNYNPYNVAANQVIDPATGRINPNATLLYQDNWSKELFFNRPRQEYMGTLSGSSAGTRYYVSLGYLNDKGIVTKSDFTRINGRVNLEQDVNKWLRFGINGSYANTKSNFTQEGATTYQSPFFFTRAVAPVYPVYKRDAQGNYVLDAKGEKIYDFGRRFAGVEHPLATLNLDIYNTLADNLSGRSFAEIKFLPELKLTVNYGIDLSSADGISFQNPTIGNAANANGRGTVSSSRDLTNNMNQLLNYTKTFGDHGFDVLLGHESYKLRTNSQSGSKENFLLPDNPQLGNAVGITGLSSSENTYAVEGYFGQVRYDYRSKYLLSGSVRRDGSSRFAPENRWGTFYSVGAGYVISQEKFFEGIDFVNTLKLKASYGLRGNDAGFGNYPYTSQYSVVNNNGQLGVRFTYLGNPDITWEKNEDIDVGAEFRVLDRISGSFDYFKRKTYDLIFNLPLALSAGGFAPPTNIGDMKNWGWEAEINADLVRKKDLTVSLGVNATHLENKITRLPEQLREKGLTTGNFKYMEGRSIYDYFVYEYAGVNPNNGEALYNKDEVVSGQPTGKKVTVNKSGDATRYYVNKTALNDVFGGIDLLVKFKGFDFSVLTSYALGGYVMDAPYSSLMFSGPGSDISTWHKDALNRWTPENKNSNIPKIQYGYQEGNAISDRFLTDASYFNIRNLSLGYTLPNRLTERYGISSTRFYIVADNVHLASKRQGLDPRQSFAGAITNVYSPIRTISFGLNTTF